MALRINKAGMTDTGTGKKTTVPYNSGVHSALLTDSVNNLVRNATGTGSSGGSGTTFGVGHAAANLAGRTQSVANKLNQQIQEAREEAAKPAESPATATYNAPAAASSGSSYTPVAYTPPQESPMSFDEFRANMGTDEIMQQVQDYISSRVNRARQEYEAQIDTTNEDAEEAARQAYVANRQGQMRMGQQLAAQGVYGGAADSQRLQMEADYQNDLQALERQRLNAVNELRRAIEVAQMTGDEQAAAAFADYLNTLQAQYASYRQNVANYNRQLAQQAAAEGLSPYMTEGSTGAAGYEPYTGSADQIRRMQEALNVTADGVWGPISTNAAGGLNAAAAWRMYQEALNS